MFRSTVAVITGRVIEPTGINKATPAVEWPGSSFEMSKPNIIFLDERWAKVSIDIARSLDNSNRNRKSFSRIEVVKDGR